MKKTLVPIAVLVLSVMAAPAALAQDTEPADCAAAVTALNSADAAHRAAVDADQKLADAEKADDVLRDARRDLKDAEEKRDVAQADVNARQKTVNDLDGPELDGAVLPEDQAAFDVAKTALAEAKKTLQNREDKVDDRQKAVNRAEKDAKQDVGDLRRKADKTDADELQKALDEARSDFDRLCGGVTTTPTPEPAPSVNLDCADFPLADGRTAQDVLNETPVADPHGLDADLDRIACEPGQDTAADGSDNGDNAADVSGDVVTPSGGVSTGVGPA